MVDDDRVEGAARNVGGKVKEGVGKLVGDEKLRREGQVDQVKGRAQNAIGGIKDRARDTLDRKTGLMDQKLRRGDVDGARSLERDDAVHPPGREMAERQRE